MSPSTYTRLLSRWVGCPVVNKLPWSLARGCPSRVGLSNCRFRIYQLLPCFCTKRERPGKQNFESGPTDIRFSHHAFSVNDTSLVVGCVALTLSDRFGVERPRLGLSGLNTSSPSFSLYLFLLLCNFRWLGAYASFSGQVPHSLFTFLGPTILSMPLGLPPLIVEESNYSVLGTSW